jgi:hypothetical protein
MVLFAPLSQFDKKLYISLHVKGSIQYRSRGFACRGICNASGKLISSDVNVRETNLVP